MAFTLESEGVLQAAVAGIPRVASTIAEIPIALRERALEAVARSYRQTVRELGHQTEADVQIWVSAVMLRLRSEVAEQRKKLANWPSPSDSAVAAKAQVLAHHRYERNTAHSSGS